MRRSTALMMACLGVSASSVLAQQPRAAIEGRVVDLESQSVVAGAEVLLPGAGRRVATDAMGFFAFEDLTPGIYAIEVRQPGYEAHTDTVTVQPGERLELRFSLGIDAIPLEPITVVARSRSEDRAVIEGRRFDGMDRREIELVLPRVRNVADLLVQARVPGVTVVDLGDWVCVEHGRVTRRGRDVNGRDYCRPVAVYLDGVRSLIPGEVLVDIDPESVERFEFLSPMQATILYGQHGESGVLAIETQSGGRRMGATPIEYEHDRSTLNLSFGLIGMNPSNFHDGVVLLDYPGGSANSFYQERSDWRFGLRGSLGFRIPALREVRISLYGVSGESTGFYTSLRPNEFPTIVRRGLTTLGVDLAARVRVKGAPSWDLRFLVGPTVAWQMLRLSEGHADEWANPETGIPPEIRWSDRSWWAWGAAAGLEWSWILDSSWAAFAAARLRLLYYGDAESWELDETRAIAEQTGNIVFLDYYQPVAFHPSFEIGLTWRR